MVSSQTPPAKAPVAERQRLDVADDAEQVDPGTARSCDREPHGAGADVERDDASRQLAGERDGDRRVGSAAGVEQRAFHAAEQMDDHR